MTVGVTVDPADPTPPFEQLRRQLEALISSGAIPEGTRLASVRQLAADLSLATGTVARAYKALESAGLVETHRGGGTKVAPASRTLTAAQRRARIAESAERFVTEGRLLAATDDELTRSLTRALAQ